MANDPHDDPFLHLHEVFKHIDKASTEVDKAFESIGKLKSSLFTTKITRIRNPRWRWWKVWEPQYISTTTTTRFHSQTEEK